MIQFIEVGKAYDQDHVALNGITFTVEQGEFVFIVGPSGAGKSTLLQLINREEEPTTGQVYVNGTNLSRLSNRHIPRLRRQVGVVFQDFKLIENKTIFENIALPLVVRGESKAAIREAVSTVLDTVGLRHKMHDLPEQLSGGEQQRIAIARATVASPAIVLADEPTGNLDPATSWEIIQLLLEVNRRGATVVVATHDEVIVNRLKRRVIALSGGRLISDQQVGVYAAQA